MKLNLDPKLKIIAIGFSIALVATFGVLYGTTDLFKGLATSNPVESTAKTTLADLQSLVTQTNIELAATETLFDEVTELTESPYVTDFQNLDSVLENLLLYSESITSITADASAFDAATIATLEFQAILDAGVIFTGFLEDLESMQTALETYKTELTAYLGTVAICPIEEDEPNAITFQANDTYYTEIVDSFNIKDFFTDTDVEDLKTFIAQLMTTNNAASSEGCVDYQSHTQSEIDEEIGILLSSFEDKSVTEIINFGNLAIEDYNQNIVDCYIAEGCNSLIYLGNIESKVVCAADQTFNSETSTCESGTQACLGDDVLDKADLLYAHIANYADTPDQFDNDAYDVLVGLAEDLYTAMGKEMTGELVPFEEYDYVTDTNPGITVLNFELNEASGEDCEPIEYAQLEIAGASNGDGNSNQNNENGSQTCPAESVALPEIGSCVCPDEVVIAIGQTCPAAQQNNQTNGGQANNSSQSNNQSNQSGVVVCQNGLIVSDVSECLGQSQQNNQTSNNDEQIVPQNEQTQSSNQSTNQSTENDNLYGSANSNQSTYYSSDPGLESNTQQEVLSSPVIQGDTGSEAIAMLLVLLFGAFNIYIWVK